MEIPMSLESHSLSCCRFDRTKKHFIIYPANLGEDMSLEGLRILNAYGHASKQDYAGALCTNQAAVDASRSSEREAVPGAAKGR